jgi:hypothetical protein
MKFKKLIGGSSLDSKGLVDTGEQDQEHGSSCAKKNRGPDSQQLILAIQVQ